MNRIGILYVSSIFSSSSSTLALSSFSASNRIFGGAIFLRLLPVRSPLPAHFPLPCEHITHAWKET
jgi:hypothetical protein